MPDPGENFGTRAKPESTTTRTPSIVRLVSAMAVESNTLRRPERIRAEGGILFSLREIAIKRIDGPAVRARPEQVGCSPDFSLAGEEDQDIPLVLDESLSHRRRRGRFHAGFRAPGEISGFNREALTGAGHDRRATEERGDRLAIERCGHDENPEIPPQNRARLERQCETEIGVHTPLVELVEDY